jgi:hypothetical protein
MVVVWVRGVVFGWCAISRIIAIGTIDFTGSF